MPAFDLKLKLNKFTTMKKILTIILLFACAAGFSQEKKNKNARYEVEVSGNCGMCKKRIEKAAYAVEGVKSATWEADTQKLLLIINEEKTSVQEVSAAVAKVGHDTETVKATDEQYQNLHGCCKYERLK
jgi:periplasmic mercuric ion binding protein